MLISRRHRCRQPLFHIQGNTSRSRLEELAEGSGCHIVWQWFRILKVVLVGKPRSLRLCGIDDRDYHFGDSQATSKRGSTCVSSFIWLSLVPAIFPIVDSFDIILTLKQKHPEGHFGGKFGLTRPRHPRPSRGY